MPSEAVDVGEFAIFVLLIASTFHELLAHVTSIVPQPNHRFGAVMFIAQGTQARRAQQEILAGPRFEPEPAGGEHPQEMPARKQQHVPLDRAYRLTT